jgi:hypothetical protein
LAKFEDMEGYDIDDLIEQHQRFLTQAAPAVSSGKQAPSLVARVAAMVRSTLGLSETEARRLVESVQTPEHTSHTALTQAALAAWFKRTEVSE